MKHLGTIIQTILIVLLLGTLAAVAGIGDKNNVIFLGEQISAGAMDSTQTFEIEKNRAMGYGLMTMMVNFNDDASDAETITMTCTASFDDNTTDGVLQDCENASGVCTSYGASWAKSVTGDGIWFWRVDIEGYSNVECSFVTGTTEAGDEITVTAQLSVK